NILTHGKFDKDGHKIAATDTAGSLVGGADYWIIRVDGDPTKIRLAESEKDAIAGTYLDLVPGGGDLNVKSFSSDDVKADANTIAITPGLGPFELGQSVI